MRVARLASLLFGIILSPALADHPLAGSWILDRSRSDDISRAIEGVVRRMNVVTRPIARSRLRKTNPAYEHITIAFAGHEARIAAGPGAPVVLPASGASIRWRRSDGEVFTVSGKLEEGTYVETFEAKDGRRMNMFSPTSDGMLVLNVTVTSPRLPSALRYKLVYRR